MCDPTNADRAEWAQAAVDTLERLTQSHAGNEELATLIQVLLTDLMHLADFHGIEFATIYLQAEGNYYEEVRDET